tara:strand:+ start:733 stop:1314 length:582 start_codon:yes stop_codon:yes gene_type:complete
MDKLTIQKLAPGILKVNLGPKSEYEEVIQKLEKGELWSSNDSIFHDSDTGAVGSNLHTYIDEHQMAPLEYFVSELYREAIGEYEKIYQMKGGKLNGLEVMRYAPGAHMKEHADIYIGEHCCSGLLYLNSDYAGGEICFPEFDLIYKPDTGDIIFFPAHYAYMHYTLPVQEKKGTRNLKYVIYTTIENSLMRPC